MFQEAIPTTRSVGEGMVELPRGEVSETRRGGAGVLELLLVDMQKRDESGYLRCEAGALGGAVGQVTVRGGRPSLALYEGADGDLLIGQVALGAIQEASGLEGSRITRHLGVDLDLIEDLHPLARLHLSEAEAVAWTEAGEAEVWWQHRQRTRREWKRLDAWMPEEDDADEQAADLGTGLPPLPFHAGQELLPGMVCTIDATSPAQCFSMVGHLAGIGHPTLVLSRVPPERLEAESGLHRSMTRWLTEKGEGEGALNASLEEVRREIDGFLHGASRACVALDGLEFLVGLHGFDRSLELVRFLVDTFTAADHLLLIPLDLDVLDARQRSILLREVDALDPARVSRWAERPARIEGHPFCSDDWAGITVPAPNTPTPAPKAEATPEDHAANRWSIRGVVDAWKEERTAEVEAVATAVPEENVLPDWATAPSANREDAPTEVSEPQLPEPIPTPLPPAVEVVEAPPPPPPPAGPKAPTVNHRGNAARKVRASTQARDGMVHLQNVEVGPVPETDDHHLVKEGMDTAAGRARDVEAGVNLPGEVVSRRDQLDVVVSGARLIHGGVPADEGPDLRVKGMDAASAAAARESRGEAAPALSSNPAVREASSRAQRSQNLTDRIAASEKASIRTMQGAFSGATMSEVTVWKRLRNLQQLGVEVQEIIDRFETDPDGALAALEEAER